MTKIGSKTTDRKLLKSIMMKWSDCKVITSSNSKTCRNFVTYDGMIVYRKHGKEVNNETTER